jgi:hypothetical protein
MSALVRSDLLSARNTAVQLKQASRHATLANAERMPDRIFGYVAMLEGALDAAEAHFDRVLDGYSPAAFDPIMPGHPFDVLASSLAQRAILSALRDRPEAVEADEARALSRARALSSPATTFQVLVHLCLARFELDDYDRVWPLLTELRELVDHNEITPLYADLWEAWFRARSGALDEGLADMKRAQEAGVQYPLWLPRALLLQADLLMGNGRHAEALHLIDDCDARIGRFRHTYLLAEVKRRRASCIRALGHDARDVAALFNEAIAMADAQGAWRFAKAARRDLAAFGRLPPGDGSAR